MSILLPQRELFLLEVYSSLEYFGRLRDTWGDMVKHLDISLASYVSKLPRDYRSRPLPYHPDIVWGEHVLPNFRETFQRLCVGYIKRSHGDFHALSYAHGPRNDFKGQMDYWDGWMTDEQSRRYGNLLNLAVRLASNICATEGAYWRFGHIADPEVVQDTVEFPSTLPVYEIDASTSVNSGNKPMVTGIYVTETPMQSPQFLHAARAAPEAMVSMSNPEGTVDTSPSFECPVNTTWHLVRRSPLIEGVPDERHAKKVTGVHGGARCPAAGFYFSPSTDGSRRWFIEGSIMPNIPSDYGTTIWLWDSQQ